MTVTTTFDKDEASTELSSRRTGMSFQRTRMSADRTLMSIMRTSLSLISFGFTIFQFFKHMEDTKLLSSGGSAPRNFGLALSQVCPRTHTAVTSGRENFQCTRIWHIGRNRCRCRRSTGLPG